MAPKKDDHRRHVPLSPHVLEILLAVLERPCHGYQIVKQVEDQTGGDIRLGTSTLYASIRRMVSSGLLEETEAPEGMESEDVRRRYYRATALGAEVAQAEARRIVRLHRLLHQAGLAEQTAKEPR